MGEEFGYDRTSMVYRVGNRNVSLSELRRSFRVHFHVGGIRAMISAAYCEFYLKGQKVDHLPIQEIERWTWEAKEQHKIPPFVFAVWFAKEHGDGKMETGRRFMRQALGA